MPLIPLVARGSPHHVSRPAPLVAPIPCRWKEEVGRLWPEAGPRPWDQDQHAEWRDVFDQAISPRGAVAKVRRSSDLLGLLALVEAGPDDVDDETPCTTIVGKRVHTKHGLQGTVRFAGTTKFAGGEWLGIELDTAGGKNNGSVQGVKYFYCNPNAGLFLRQADVEMIDGAREMPLSPRATRLSLGKAKAGNEEHKSKSVVALRHEIAALHAAAEAKVEEHRSQAEEMKRLKQRFKDGREAMAKVQEAHRKKLEAINLDTELLAEVRLANVVVAVLPPRLFLHRTLPLPPPLPRTLSCS